jgi:hypothetical protein
MSNREKWLGDFSMSLARGECALWLGPDWDARIQDEDLAHIASKPWLAVWSESQSRELAIRLEDSEPNKDSDRLLVEVPDSVEEALGTRYSLASFCPFFYVPERKTDDYLQQQYRMEKDRELQKIQNGTLVLGYMPSEEYLQEILIGPVNKNASTVSMIVLLGMSEDRIPKLLSSSVRQKLACFPGTLTDLLRQLDESIKDLPSGVRLCVGSTRVDLLPLLATDPPLDQDFIILTERDIAEVRPDENKSDLLLTFLKGSYICWRAFAAGLPWRRFKNRYVAEVKRSLESCRGHETDWKTVRLTIEGEPGAGLSVCLQDIAFECARSHYPTLMLRPRSDNWSYDRLRIFLERLRAVVRKHNPSDSNIPLLILFDAQHSTREGLERINNLVNQLSNDRHRAVIVQGGEASLHNNQGRFPNPTQNTYRSDEKPHHNNILPVVRADLDEAELTSLRQWADKAQSMLPGNIPHPMEQSLNTLLRSDWRDGTNPPLLVCLYYILAQQYHGDVGLGRHLWKRIKEALPDEASATTSDNTPLTPEQVAVIIKNVDLTKHTFNGKPVTRQKTLRATLLLAGLGCLRETLPVSLLGRVLDLKPQEVSRLLEVLDKTTLIVTDLPPSRDSRRETRSYYAPAAYYDITDDIGTRHPVLGRLLLEWLMSEEGRSDLEFVMKEVPEWGSWAPPSPESYSLGVLKPVFECVTQRAEEVAFAEGVSCHWLRLIRHSNVDDLHRRFQEENKLGLLNAFDWLKEPIMRNSATLLHSRGITRYKYAGDHELDLPEKRKQYNQAAIDLERALKLAQEDGVRDEPGNILTSLGLCYLHWSHLEKEHNNLQEWRRLNDLTVSALRNACLQRTNNLYAAYGLARYLVETCERMQEDGQREGNHPFTEHLTEALELLSNDPAEDFREEWDEVRARAFGLLNHEWAQHIILQLKQDGQELGYALDALKMLGGRIPKGVGDADPRAIQEALDAVTLDGSVAISCTSTLADLLRYALFSSLPERQSDPQYKFRHDLICKLHGSKYLNTPIWLYDYAVLCFQTGHIENGEEAFNQLRRGAQFRNVPRDRHVLWSEDSSSNKPRKFRLKITNGGSTTDKGWGVLLGEALRSPVPFGPSVFVGHVPNLEAGSTMPCQIRFRGAGPWAEPLPRRE